MLYRLTAAGMNNPSLFAAASLTVGHFALMSLGEIWRHGRRSPRHAMPLLLRRSPCHVLPALVTTSRAAPATGEEEVKRKGRGGCGVLVYPHHKSWCRAHFFFLFKRKRHQQAVGCPDFMMLERVFWDVWISICWGCKIGFWDVRFYVCFFDGAIISLRCCSSDTFYVAWLMMILYVGMFQL